MNASAAACRQPVLFGAEQYPNPGQAAASPRHRPLSSPPLPSPRAVAVVVRTDRESSSTIIAHLLAVVASPEARLREPGDAGA